MDQIQDRENRYEKYSDEQLLRLAVEVSCPCSKADIEEDPEALDRTDLIDCIESEGLNFHDYDEYPYWEEPFDVWAFCPYILETYRAHGLNPVVGSTKSA